MRTPSRPYLQGIRLFNEGRYYDAHEAWEEQWLVSEGQTRDCLQMLVQTAVALHHHSTGNVRGARSLYQKVFRRLSALPGRFLGLDLVSLRSQLERCSAALDATNGTLELCVEDRPRLYFSAGEGTISGDGNEED